MRLKIAVKLSTMIWLITKHDDCRMNNIHAKATDDHGVCTATLVRGAPVAL